MKKNRNLILVALVLSVVGPRAFADAPAAADQLNQALTQVGVEQFTAPDYKPGIIKHGFCFAISPL